MHKILTLTFILFSQILLSQSNNFSKFEEQYSKGNIDEAISYLEKAINNQEKPKFQLYAMLGDIYLDRREFEKAAIHHEKMIEFVDEKTDLGLAYFTVGSSYYFSQNYTKAIEYLEKALKSGYKDSGIANNLGWCYSEINQYSKAINYFELAYNEDPKLINNINNLGYAYYLNKEYKKAKELILKAKEIDDKNSFVYRNLGLIAMKQNEKKKACSFLEESIQNGIIEKWGKLYIKELINFCK